MDKPLGAPEERYEKRDVNVRQVTLFGVGLVVVIGIGAIVSMWFVFKYLAFQTTPGPPPSPFFGAQPLPPGPRLQATPAMDLKAHRAAEESRLHSYGWVDRNAGIVRIPVEQAMDLVAKRGLPYWPPSAGDDAGGDTKPKSAIRDPQSAISSGDKK